MFSWYEEQLWCDRCLGTFLLLKNAQVVRGRKCTEKNRMLDSIEPHLASPTAGREMYKSGLLRTAALFLARWWKKLSHSNGMKYTEMQKKKKKKKHKQTNKQTNKKKKNKSVFWRCSEISFFWLQKLLFFLELSRNYVSGGASGSMDNWTYRQTHTHHRVTTWAPCGHKARPKKWEEMAFSQGRVWVSQTLIWDEITKLRSTKKVKCAEQGVGEKQHHERTNMGINVRESGDRIGGARDLLSVRVLVTHHSCAHKGLVSHSLWRPAVANWNTGPQIHSLRSPIWSCNCSCSLWQWTHNRRNTTVARTWSCRTWTWTQMWTLVQNTGCIVVHVVPLNPNKQYQVKICLAKFELSVQNNTAGIERFWENFKYMHGNDYFNLNIFG